MYISPPVEEDHKMEPFKTISVKCVCQSDGTNTCVMASAFASKKMCVCLAVKNPSFFSDEHKCFKQLSWTVREFNKTYQTDLGK